MNDKRKLWLWLGAIVVAGLVLIFVGQALFSGSSGDPADAALTARREPPPKRAAPGQDLGSASSVSQENPPSPERDDE